jgi:hypothetical protein
MFRLLIKTSVCVKIYLLFSLALQFSADYGLLIYEVS